MSFFHAFLLFSLFSAFFKATQQFCEPDDVDGKESSFWIHQNFFNVTCLHGKMQVVNCVTQNGTRIALGTVNFAEDGFKYSCKLHFEERTLNETRSVDEEGPPEDGTVSVPECDFMPATGRSEYVRGGYAISCVDNRLLGCVDAFGDLARSGQFFLLPRGQLRRCVVYARGRWAKAEQKGCFNGTREDDPTDRRLHVPKGRTWRSGQFELRCGEEGIHVNKCLVEGRRIHVGTAWVDRENVLNMCQ